MTYEKQLEEWVKGNSLHNNETDECCPDFSCCNKKVNTPLDVKLRFQKAFLEKDKTTVNHMLSMFLGNALSGENVYIADGDVKTAN